MAKNVWAPIINQIAGRVVSKLGGSSGGGSASVPPIVTQGVGKILDQLAAKMGAGPGTTRFLAGAARDYSRSSGASDAAFRIGRRFAKTVDEDTAKEMGHLIGSTLRKAVNLALDPIANRVATYGMNVARRGIERINRIADDPQAAIEAGRERGGIRGRLGAGFAGGVQALQHDRPLQGIGSALGAAGDVVGMVPGAGKPAESLLKLNDALLKSIDRIRLWNERLHEGNMRFAEFSGQMLSVQQQQMARDIQLDIRKGDELAASADRLARAKSRHDAQMADIEVPWQQLKNFVGTKLLELKNDMQKQIGKPFGLFQGKTGPDGPTLHDWMSDVWKQESERADSLIPPPGRWGPKGTNS